MIRIFRHEFWNNFFSKKITHTLNIPKRLHWRRNFKCAKFVTLQEKDVCKIAWYKIMGILGQLTWVTSRKTKEGVGFHHIKIRGVKSSEPQQYMPIKHLIFDWAVCWCDVASNEGNWKWETRCPSPSSKYMEDNVGV